MRSKQIVLVSLGIFLLSLLSSRPSIAQGEFFLHPDNAVLKRSYYGWDDGRVDAPFVLREGGNYFMWYAGSPYSYPTITSGLGLAASFDGEQWTKYAGNPILENGPPGSWDRNGVSSPSVIHLGNTYYMAYAGTNNIFWRIGLALSRNRVTWTKYSGNPVFTQGEFGEWDGQGVRDPMVISDGSGFKLYYTGDDGSTTRIGLATSTDGLTWIRAENNPVLPEGPSGWDSLGVASPFVHFEGLSYFMWYSGYAETDTAGYPSYNIGFATSTDGSHWEKADSVNPVLEHGDQRFNNRAVFDPSVLLVGDIFQMWLSGREYNEALNSNFTSIGLARSVPLWLDVMPSTVEIPAGEYLDFSVMVRNTSPESVAFQLWSDVTLPNGNPYSGNPVFGPEDLEVEANGTYTAGISLFVPYQAPPNSGYRLTTEVGNYPIDIWDFSVFEFEILPPL